MDQPDGGADPDLTRLGGAPAAEPHGADVARVLQESLTGRYEIIRELGAGGMATVYLARDVRHTRQVALKVMRRTAADTASAERFHREIATSGTLQHPHILPVFDSGDAGSLRWFTMPFVAGESLRDRMTREGQMPLGEALRITREVALALDYAHRQGIVHRDIKPENILLSDGQALVADFGISKASNDTDVTLTQVGLSLGTVAYMSPEQTLAEPDLDGRSDIYSLATVLYEMLAGRRPIEGSTASAVIARRLSGEVLPSLTLVRPDVPEGVAQAVTRALARARADRPATAADFAQALANPAVTHVVTAPPPRSRWMRLAALTAVMVAAAAAGAVVWRTSFGGSGATGSAGRTRIAVLPFENTGSPDEDYFVDGMTDAIRGKLSELAPVEVIARESSKAYRQTTKGAKDIGRELGVAFLLRGTIRFDKSGGTTRVQVSPELVQVSTVTTRWTHPFDDVLTDMFKVQGDIAGQVVTALGGALGAEARTGLDYVATKNLDVYEELLKGDREQDWPLNDGDPAKVRAALPHYLKAVELDPQFAIAHERLAIAYALTIAAGGASPDLADASRRAAERALTLAPDRVEGHLAMAVYNRWVLAGNVNALSELAKVPERLGANDEFFLRTKGAAELALGHEDVGLALLRRVRDLNPLSSGASRVLSKWLTWTRHYPEALQVIDRAIQLDPRPFEPHSWKVVAHLAAGNVADARAQWLAAAAGMPPRNLPLTLRLNAAPIGVAWMLDEAQGARWAAGMQAGGFASVAVAQDVADYYWERGDRVGARPFIDSARGLLEQLVAGSPNVAINHAELGLMYAFLDRKQAAVDEGLRAAALLPISKDGYQGVFIQAILAHIYIVTGEPDKAIDTIEPLLKRSGYLTPAWLRIDPTYAPLKGHPRFDRLVAGTR